MPSGLPWSDPDSDPLADLRAYMDAARDEYLKGASLGERLRRQFDIWTMYHLLYCGGSFLFEKMNGFTEWVECAACHSRLILPLGKHKGKINGPRPSLVIHDEMVDFDVERIYQGGRRSGKSARMADWLAQGDRSALTPDTHHDALIALCLEHPWLSKPTNAGGSAAATRSTRSAT